MARVAQKASIVQFGRSKEGKPANYKAQKVFVWVFMAAVVAGVAYLFFVGEVASIALYGAGRGAYQLGEFPGSRDGGAEALGAIPGSVLLITGMLVVVNGVTTFLYHMNKKLVASGVVVAPVLTQTGKETTPRTRSFQTKDRNENGSAAGRREYE